MKNIALLIFTFISFSVFTQTSDEIFTDANLLYKQGKYKESLEKYQEITNMGYQSPDLYFNMANSYYKLEKIAPAILYYKRAIKLNPNMDDAIFNLKMAQQQTVDKFDTIPKTFLVKFWNWLANIMTVHNWSVFSVILAFVSAILFLIYFFANSSVLKRLSFVISLTAASVMVFSLVIAHQQTVWQKTNKEAVIMAENSYVKVAPNYESEDSFILHEGTEVLVVDQVDEWMRIKLKDGKIGWINIDDVSLV